VQVLPATVVAVVVAIEVRELARKKLKVVADMHNRLFQYP
jgi:hypothetical protein